MRTSLRTSLGLTLAGLLTAAAVALGDDKAPCPSVVEPACAPPTCKVCVPKEEVKKTVKYVYACKEKEICLPHCRMHLFHHSTCEDCCAHAKIRTVRQLVKKPVTEEKKEVRCEVAHVAPSCPPPCPAPCPAPGAEAAPVIVVPAAPAAPAKAPGHRGFGH
jgi:hypothetical protein